MGYVFIGIEEKYPQFSCIKKTGDYFRIIEHFFGTLAVRAVRFVEEQESTIGFYSMQSSLAVVRKQVGEIGSNCSRTVLVQLFQLKEGTGLISISHMRVADDMFQHDPVLLFVTIGRIRKIQVLFKHIGEPVEHRLTGYGFFKNIADLSLIHI